MAVNKMADCVQQCYSHTRRGYLPVMMAAAFSIVAYMAGASGSQLPKRKKRSRR
jgi:hypothetical protein